MNDRVFICSRRFGAVRLRSWERNRAGVVFSAPSAARAQVLSMVLSLLVKYSGASMGSHAAAP